MVIAVSIVEDDPQTRKIFANWINGAPGFRLAGDWGDAEKALEGLPAKKPNVVLMDINLPGMSGVDAVKRLKPLLPDTQFVMLTVYEDADHIYNALAAGATGYVPETNAAGRVARRGGGGPPWRFADDQQHCAQSGPVLQANRRAQQPTGPIAPRTGGPGAARAGIPLQGNR